MQKTVMRSEDGVVLIIALLILLVLTLIGISAISTTTFENSISGNECCGTEAFYASEAGIQVALDQLPDTKPIEMTKIGTNSFYWTGTSQDKNNPQRIKSFGLYEKAGFDSSWAFTRFQIHTTGESFGALKELEVQACFGPYKSGTQYD